MHELTSYTTWQCHLKLVLIIRYFLAILDIGCNRMFLFMYCNNHCPVNLKEKRRFELIVSTSDYYQSNKKRGKKLSQKMSYFAVGMETGKLIIGYRAQQITCCIGYESVTDSLWNR